MSPLLHLNQSAGQSPLSVVEITFSRKSKSGGSTGGIPVDGSSGFKVVVSGISVVAVDVVDVVVVAGRPVVEVPIFTFTLMLML